MDGKNFDELTRAASDAGSRRGALRLMAGAALAAVIAKISPVAAKKKGKGKGKNKKKKCRKLNQGCGGKKKCCKGLTCTDGTCIKPSEPECDSDNDCAANEICQNGVCVPEPAECDNDNDCESDEICQDGECVPEPPKCVNDNDCGSNEICQDGECVPEPPECDSDNDCDNGEICQGGECVPNPSGCEVVDGRCIQRCEVQADCPGASSCRNFSPETSPSIEDGVCIDEANFLCDTTPCTVNNNCASDEVCVMLFCEGGVPVGRCQEFSVFS